MSAAPAPKGAANVVAGRAVPRHVAIIMDGNGRWAQQRGLPRVAGHKAGAEAVRRAMQCAVDLGVEVLTLYAFSSENWRRSPEEIAAAARALAVKAAAGTLDPRDIDEQAIAAGLQTEGLPDLDLLIRTSGEIRLSNFLFWQAAYSELLFVDTLWTDFDEQAFADAIADYAARERRFGGRGAEA